MTGRGLSPVIGLVVLVGVVAISSVGLLVVGASLTESSQGQAEIEQTEQSFDEFADTVNQLVNGEIENDEFDIFTGEDARTYVDDDAGHVSLDLVVNESTGDVETIVDEPLGAYVAEVEDGPQFAYQGGAVWRQEDDGHVGAVDRPSLQFRADPDPTLTFPYVQVRDGGLDATGDAGTLRAAEQSEPFPVGGNLSNPVAGDHLELRIESEYCQGWENHVLERTDGDVEESCDDNADDTLVARLGVGNGTETVDDSDDGPSEPNVTDDVDATDGDDPNGTHTIDDDHEPGTPDPVEDPTVADPEIEPDDPDTTDEVYGVYMENDFHVENAGGNIDGSVGAHGNVTIPDDITVTDGYDDGVASDRDPYDEAIQDRIDAADPDDWQATLTENGNTITGGETLYVESAEDLAAGSNHVTFDVTDGDVDVVVEEHFVTDGSTQLVVDGHEETGNTVNVYVAGDVSLDGWTSIGTPDNPVDGFGPNLADGEIDDGDVNAEAFTLYGAEDTQFTAGSAVQIEGSVVVPGGTGVGDMSFQMAGALYLGDFEGSSFSPNIYAAGSEGRTVEGESDPGTLEGTVYDGDVDGDGNPVEGEVTIEGESQGHEESTTTASDGSFAFEGLPEDDYAVSVDPIDDDYDPLEFGPAEVVDDGVTTVEAPVEPTGDAPDVGELDVSVETTDGTAVPAEVTVSWVEGLGVQRGDTGSDGEYEFNVLDPGNYTATVDPEDDELPEYTVSDEAHVVGGDATDVTVTYDEPDPENGTLNVEVFDGDEDSTDGLDADVVVESLEDGSTVTGTTSAPAGTTTFDLEPGEYDVVATPDGDFEADSLSDHGMSVTVAAEDDSDVTFTLEPTDGDGGGDDDSTDERGTDVHYLHVSKTVLEVED